MLKKDYPTKINFIKTALNLIHLIIVQRKYLCTTNTNCIKDEKYWYIFTSLPRELTLSIIVHVSNSCQIDFDIEQRFKF